MKYNIEQLSKAIEQGEKPNFYYFWGHQPSKTGKMTKSCLSQWFESGFEHQSIHYPTAEHWMMAEKARLFKDSEIEHLIIAAKTAKEAKALGRKVRGFDPQCWEANAYEIVKKGNELKFSQSADLKAFLSSTSNKVLVEASPLDRIWGIGLAASDWRAQEVSHWQGRNLLGFALMEVRDKL